MSKSAFEICAAGADCYRLLHQREHIGAVFSLDGRWIIALRPSRRWRGLPDPFSGLRHSFDDLPAIKSWLGING
jgi:hypothetical protein